MAISLRGCFTFTFVGLLFFLPFEITTTKKTSDKQANGIRVRTDQSGAMPVLEMFRFTDQNNELSNQRANLGSHVRGLLS